MDLENLTLTTQPFKTLKLFALVAVQYLKRSILYILTRGGWLMLFCTVLLASGLLLMAVDGPHEKVFGIPSVNANYFIPLFFVVYYWFSMPTNINVWKLHLLSLLMALEIHHHLVVTFTLPMVSHMV